VSASGLGDPRSSHTYATDLAPVRITVRTGWWRFLPTTDAGGGASVTAQLLRLNGGSESADLVVTAVGRSVRELEQTLGFRLPSTVEGALRRVRPRDDLVLPGPVGGWKAAQARLLLDIGLDPEELPWRASRVDADGCVPDTYGRLMHADRPLRSWQHDPYRVEIVDSSRDNPFLDEEPFQLTYRICLGDRVVFAGDDVTVAARLTDRSDDAVREVVRQVLDRPRNPRDLTYTQQSFLEVQQDRLTLRTRSVTPPYPPRTRIRVDIGGGIAATGIVRGPVVRDGRTTGYLWRPDVADLPGHPGYRNPDHLRYADAAQVRDTLAARDTAVEGPDGPLVLTFGATVASIDDPRFERGRVLRAVDDGGRLTYDVQPHNDRAARYRVDVNDVIPLTGTAWPTIDRLLDARTAAGVPLISGEILVAVREIAMMPTGAPLVPAALVRHPLLSPDRILDPGLPSAAHDPAAPDATPGELPGPGPSGRLELPHQRPPEPPDMPGFDAGGLDL